MDRLKRKVLGTLLLLGLMIGESFSLAGTRGQYLPEFPPCSPTSERSQDVPRYQENGWVVPMPELDFCSKWNPEFTFNGHHCCAKPRASRRKRGRSRSSCSLQRAKGTYCGEITPEQEEYTRLAEQAQLGDVLELISRDLGQKESQAYCSVNSGFLAWGRRLIPSAENRIVLRAPDRCTEFGTDSMVGMLEWSGREIGQQYAASEYEHTRLVIGDISAPRGGCLSGRGGRRGHLSHTTGQDVDVSFLVAKPGATSPVSFHKEFDAKENWKMLKRFFKNPYACIKVIFLDKRLMSKLSKVAYADEDWSKYRRFIRHMPGHRNHFHIRIGEGPGVPGCVVDAKPELEQEELGDDGDLSKIDELLELSPSDLVLDQSPEKSAGRGNGASGSPTSSTPRQPAGTQE